MRLLAILSLFIAVSCAQDLDESFTIFLDLDDFHVTKLVDSHEFLHPDTIGEHDNVLLELSEGEVEHFMAKHDTFECEHPEELHEVVSFLQESMWETPSSVNFIDDAIQSNYAQNAAVWDNLHLKNPAAAGPYPFGLAAPQMPGMPNGLAAFFPNMPTPAVARAPATSPQAALAAEIRPMPSRAPEVARAPAPSPPAAALTQSNVASPVADVPLKATGPVTLTVDPDEKDAVNRFLNAYHAWKYFNQAVDGLGDSQPALAAQPSAEATPEKKSFSLWDSLMDEDDKKLFNMFSQKMAPPPQMAAHAPALGDLDNVISKIVDDAFKNALVAAPTASTGAAPAPASNLREEGYEVATSENEVSEAESSKHHHHHHSHHEPAPVPEPAAPAPAVASDGFTPEERQALKDILKDFAHKEHEAEPKAVPAPATETSHITTAPEENVPESVYSQQLVDFNEKPQTVKHHVPKRILIPRMEEPGPVIGGGSRPVHITLPPMGYDAPLPPASRPAPPAATKSAAVTTASKPGEPSIKGATTAVDTDEALTAPEVVIF